MTRTDVEAWVAAYERVWRTPGTDLLGELFTEHASYLPSPWEEPLVGLDAIGRFWEAERVGPDEGFTLSTQVVALDGPVAVVRAEVDYATGNRWRDLWVLRFATDGRCEAFEEWPFAPDQPDGH
jgi:SnoaL-like domain